MVLILCLKLKWNDKFIRHPKLRQGIDYIMSWLIFMYRLRADVRNENKQEL